MDRISYILFDLNGRINRTTWLAFFAALAVAESVAGLLLRRMFDIPAPLESGGGFSPWAYFDDEATLFAGLMFLWPSVAVDVKRWHDMGRSGWLTAIVYGPILAVYALGASGAGGTLSAPVASGLLSLIGLVFLTYLIVLAARKGSPASNRFGAA
jgi:uncharacterized membrane protein YhaH (DUF805 family)